MNRAVPARVVRGALLVLFLLQTTGLLNATFSSLSSSDARVAEQAASLTPCALRPGQACHCPAWKRAAGKCCCSKSGSKAAGCCSTKPANHKPAAMPAKRPCCAAKSQPAAELHPVESSALELRSGCPCGDDESSFSLRMQEPRLRLTIVSCPVANPLGETMPEFADRYLSPPLGHTSPPPKSPFAA